MSLVEKRIEDWKKESYNSVDVACGSTPQGTTNVDMYVGKTSHHEGAINPANIPDFVQADAHDLPFNDKSFGLGMIRHGLEHMENPLQVLRELERVSDRSIIIVPNNPMIQEHEDHLFSWSKQSFTNILGKVWDNVEVMVDSRPSWIYQSRVINWLYKMGFLGKILARKYCRFLGVELIAFCSNQRKL